MKTIRFIVVFQLLLASSLVWGQAYETLEDRRELGSVTTGSGISSPVSITIIYDNYVSLPGTTADWGFSLFIEGLDKKVLFDNGTRQDIFESNVKMSGLDLTETDLLVLSHEHGDHTGGIPALGRIKSGIPAIMPHTFTPGFKTRMSDFGLKPVLVDGPSIICNHLYTSGEFDFQIAEQALVIDTREGLVVITGCAHPGIIVMIKKIKSDFRKDIYMVMGGFHLMNMPEAEMSDIIREMKELGVVKCGATHCTGDRQIGMFRKAYGNDYVELGTGNKIIIN